MAENPLFLDTAYIYALFNNRDQWHPRALEWQRKLDAEQRPLLTTEFVCIEIANGLAALKFRQAAARIIHSLQETALVRVIPASAELSQQALSLTNNARTKIGA